MTMKNYLPILRDEWGFDGVVTDWGAMHDRMAGFKAGCDLMMPGSNYMLQEVLDAVSKGILDESFIDRSVQRIIKMVSEINPALSKRYIVTIMHIIQLARIAAEQSAVLLKNEDNILPLKKNRK